MLNAENLVQTAFTYANNCYEALSKTNPAFQKVPSKQFVDFYASACIGTVLSEFSGRTDQGTFHSWYSNNLIPTLQQKQIEPAIIVDFLKHQPKMMELINPQQSTQENIETYANGLGIWLAINLFEKNVALDNHEMVRAIGHMVILNIQSLREAL